MFSVLPAYNQIEIRDPLPESPDYPEYETGEEPVIASTSCITVTTQRDIDGKVAIEVVSDNDRPEGLQELFDGTIVTLGEEVMVGNLIAGDEQAFRVGPGTHGVKIYVDRPGDASRVRFVLPDLACATSQT